MAGGLSTCLAMAMDNEITRSSICRIHGRSRNDHAHESILSESGLRRPKKVRTQGRERRIQLHDDASPLCSWPDLVWYTRT